MTTPRVVLITRPTEQEELLLRHGTREQARFFLASRAQRLEEVEARHQAFQAALQLVLAAIPVEWRRVRVDRAHLARFLFEPADLVVALGQDGLVANAAKYLAGQPVIGLDPDPGRNAGILVPHPPAAAGDLLRTAAAGRGKFEERTMLRAELDDGQALHALNEVYVGHRTHQSSKYLIRAGGKEEYQSSSGLLVATGTGATGWARSVHRNRVTEVSLPTPEEKRLVFLVREAWPSKGTGTTLTDGSIGPRESLEVVSRLNEDGIVFGDGIEQDALELLWGRRLQVRLADQPLRLMRG